MNQITDEAVVDPARPIIDPHHHLWDRGERYLLHELLEDIGTGHNIVATVFVECSSMYRADGPEELRSLGETEFVNGVAAMSASGEYGPPRICEGIVAHVDLSLGHAAEDVLARHLRASARLRGVRNLMVWDPDEAMRIPGHPIPPDLLVDPHFRDGVAVLGRLGLGLDALVLHPQMPQLAELAYAVPEVPIIVDHLGLPMRIGRYRDRQAEAFAEWRAGLRPLAEAPNIYMKIGGFGLPWMDLPSAPKEGEPHSVTLAAAWQPYIDACIEAFGPERCMFESNFPVERSGSTYRVLWNAYKRAAAGFSEDEKDQLFRGSAAWAYRLQ